MVTGYLHRDYAESLAEFGEPLLLPKSEGWILKRRIPDFPAFDAMGCYPLFACSDWSRLDSDLDELKADLVSLTLVADPFGNHDVEGLRRCFRDLVIPYKEHFVVDLSLPPASFASARHRDYARKALRDLSVEKCASPPEVIQEWTAMYGSLINRHNIRGISAFSERAFEKQLRVPGAVMFRGVHDGRTVCMTLWYIAGDIVYYHLGASSDAGYQLRASYALFWSAIEYFSDHGFRRLSLGAGAGVRGCDTDGLSQFKRGWSTGTRTAYLCGRIFDPTRYSGILQAKAVPASEFFPAYRAGEIAE